MFRPLMVAVVRLYTLKLVNYYHMQIQFDVEYHNISNTITFIGFIVSNNTVTPRRYPYFDVVVGLVWSHDPKNYAGCSICYW
jgi:hypothetical protein